MKPTRKSHEEVDRLGKNYDRQNIKNRYYFAKQIKIENIGTRKEEISIEDDYTEDKYL